MKLKLKRCPFCNSHDLEICRDEKVTFVRCHECGATGPQSLKNIERAAAFWNEGYNEGHNLVRYAPDLRFRSDRNDIKEIEQAGPYDTFDTA